MDYPRAELSILPLKIAGSGYEIDEWNEWSTGFQDIERWNRIRDLSVVSMVEQTKT